MGGLRHRLAPDPLSESAGGNLPPGHGPVELVRATDALRTDPIKGMRAEGESGSEPL